jgi:DNA-binding winged helix-turn-helix (wHTH) protein/TolB-like protein
MSQTAESDNESDGPYHLGEWLVEPSLNRLTRGDKSVHLEPRAMDLLVFLSHHPDDVLSHETLIDGVWAEQFVGEGVLRQTIAALRDALGDDAKDPTFIETIPKRGYRLIADVAEVKPEQPPPVKKQDEGFRPRWSHVLTIAIAVVIALLVVLPPEGIWQRITNQGPSEPGSRLRIVVLPFENLGPPEDEFFAGGITDEITSRLVGIRELGVIGRASARLYKHTDKEIEQIGSELGADYILVGTVRWQDLGEGRSQIRVTPQLIKVVDGTHLWAHIYDEELSDIFAVQSNIARLVIETLELTLQEPQRRALETPPTENLEAYNAYLRGLEHRYVGAGPEERQLAIAMFERAVELDPGFALGYAALSYAHSSAFWSRFDLDPERMVLATRAAVRALELDPKRAWPDLRPAWPERGRDPRGRARGGAAPGLQ